MPARYIEIGGFTKIPYRLFSSGEAARLTPSVALLLIALFDHANRNRGLTFRVSDRTLAADTNLAPRTICDGRKRLIERKWLLCSRNPGQSYQYILQIPELVWVPQKARPRGQCRPRGYSKIC